MTIKERLELALAALFRPAAKQTGFWGQDGHIVRGLLCSVDEQNRPVWREDKSSPYRYLGFALMGLADWRTSVLGTVRYDSQLDSNLAWYGKAVLTEALSRIPSYAIGPCLYAFNKFLDLMPNEQVIDVLIEDATRRFTFDFPEDALLFVGLSRNWDRLNYSQKKIVRDGIDKFLATQTNTGLFVLPAYPRISIYHQNQMYICWGLGEYGLRERSEQMRRAIHRALDLTVRERMLPDGGLLWHEGGDFIHRMHNWYRKAVRREIIDVEKLYECHQTFFVNAVDYLSRLGDERFIEEAKRALQWIFGNNSRKQDLVELTGLGIPWRVISLDGEWRIKGDMFKGVYEVGSYIRALSLPEPRASSIEQR